jgi:hypothetical protein
MSVRQSHLPNNSIHYNTSQDKNGKPALTAAPIYCYDTRRCYVLEESTGKDGYRAAG